MGLFEKIKDVFSKTSFESIQDFEKEIQELRRHTMFSEIVAIIGTGGRLKGLPLIYSANQEDKFKKLVAKISEVMFLVNNLDIQEDLKEVILNFNGLYLIFIPIQENFGFLGVSPTENELKVFREWMKKNLKTLNALFKT
jgi:hypothetical protein